MPEIRAPITGNVLQIHVAAGDVVSAGDIVAVLESMKLEIPIESETSGLVETIVVAEGDSVGEDDVMVIVS